jgi:5-oxoprolinase (ATP-hydrolysing) subunit A
MRQIDLNCDMGESRGSIIVGEDSLVMPFVSSANIACGFHGGDPMVMRSTIDLALSHGVAIGAHPSFYDLEGFGRNNMDLSPEEIYHLVLYQVAALKGMAEVCGGRVHHVKPHGALYNMAATSPAYSNAIATAIKDLDPTMILYGLSGSELIAAGEAAGLQTCSEVFADRTYQDDGSLTPRTMPDALITDKAKAIDQVMMMAGEGMVRSVSGKMVSIVADTICIHGDHVGASVFAKELNRSLTAAGYQIKATEAKYG